MVDHILAYLENTAASCGERTAYVGEDGSFDYAALMRSAKRIGTRLRDLPMGFMGAVLMDVRSAQSVKAFMGIVYAGGCYAPLDPALPTERLRMIFSTLCPRVILTDEKCLAAAEACADGVPVILCGDAERTPEDEIYLASVRARSSAKDDLCVMYTSGSTGVPKGVVHSMSSMIAYTEATVEKYGLTKDVVYGSQSPFFYANSIIDIYPPMATGGRVVMIPPAALSFPKRLIAFLQEHRITELTMTPSSFISAANAGVLTPGCLPDLKYAIMCGERMPWKQMEQWIRAVPNGHAWYFYGSTEMYSVSVSRVERQYADGEAIPSGKPFDTVSLLFLDEDQRPLPPGVPGEILVSSPMTASGYLRSPDLTAGVFVRDPTGQSDRIYVRSGDTGYLNADGELVVCGRRDDQIKHRGYRMEMGEVRAALDRLDGVDVSCCFFDRDSGSIVCFYTGSASEKEVLGGLRRTLARYMLPDVCVRLEQLPYTPNMKIDTAALKARWARMRARNP